MNKVARLTCILCVVIGAWYFVCRARMGGETLLMKAAAGESPLLTKLLLLLRAKVDARNLDGETPLFYAAANGRPANIELLLQFGADVDAKDRRGRTPLCMATWLDNGDLRSMGLLLSHEASASAGATAALRCLGESIGRAEKARFLILRGGDPRALDEEGQPLLVRYAASDDDYSDAMEVLHSVGHVDLNVKGKGGYTALMASAKRGHPTAVKVLLQMGAVCSARADDGRTAFDMALEGSSSRYVMSRRNDYQRVIQLLKPCSE